MPATLSLFGSPRLHKNGETKPLKLNKPMSLLCLLATKADWVARSELGFLYFPDVDEKLALTNTRSLIFRAKKFDWTTLELEKQRVRWLIDSDVSAFRDALKNKQYQEALALYTGEFLQGLSVKDAPEFERWLTQERIALAKERQNAALHLGNQHESNHQFNEAASLYQLVLGTDALNDDAMLGFMRAKQATDNRSDALEAYETFCEKLDSELGIAAAENIQELANTIRKEAGLAPLSLHRETARLADLNENTRNLFLCLALQDKPNLSVARNALNLTLSELSAANEDLIQHALIDNETTLLAQEQAEHWLAEHPTDQQPLLLALARNTKSTQAYSLFKRIFELTQGFGGMGDLRRAREAYLKQAQTHMDALEHDQAATLLTELRHVEETLDADPDPETRFTEAYALERQGQFKDALKLLNQLPQEDHNPNIEALLSVLLWRTGKSDEAKSLAEKALKSGLDWLWARGTASNTLGYLAFANEHLQDAASHFKKAASLYQAANEKQRWVGSLNNHAIALGRIAEEASETKQASSTNQDLFKSAEQAYLATLDALEKSQENPALKSLILLNLGVLFERHGKLEKADNYKLQALPFAKKANALDAQARIHLSLGNSYLVQQRYQEARLEFQEAIEFAVSAGEYFIQGMAAANLAELDKDPDAFEVALELLEQSGNQDRFSFFQEEYERTIKFRLDEALNEGNLIKAQALFKKLGLLYSTLELNQKVTKVQDALSALEQTTDLEKNREILLAMVDARDEQITNGMNQN